MLRVKSIDWHSMQFLITPWTSSLLTRGSIFCTKYKILFTPMWCISCNSSNSPVPKQHIGTSSSFLTSKHFLFTYVSASALFFSEGTNTTFNCNPNSDITSFDIPNLHHTIISPVPFVHILPLSCTVDFTQLSSIAELSHTSTFLKLYIKTRSIPFNTASNSVISM